jgi:hypothetical protein
LICTFGLAHAHHAAAVLLVGFIVLHKALKILFCFVDIVLDDLGLVLLLGHFLLVKRVGGVDLF